jgi:hypothetical protein
MAQNARITIDLPVSPSKISLPKGVDARLQSLLDKQDRGESLSAKEKSEAEGLVELAEMLSLMRVRTERIGSEK